MSGDIEITAIAGIQGAAGQPGEAPMSAPFEYFDGAAHWARLTPDQQAAIGAAALEYVAGWEAFLKDAAGRGPTPLGCAAREARRRAEEKINALVYDALPTDAWRDQQGRARLPSIIGPVCRVCGCSEQDACPGGCGWAEPSLCTACVKPGDVR